MESFKNNNKKNNKKQQQQQKKKTTTTVQHFSSNKSMSVTLLCMIRFSKIIPLFVRQCIAYKMSRSKTKKKKKNLVELEDTCLYITGIKLSIF